MIFFVFWLLKFLLYSPHQCNKLSRYLSDIKTIKSKKYMCTVYQIYYLVFFHMIKLIYNQTILVNSILRRQIIWYKHSHKSFFAKDPDFKRMALVSNIDKYQFLYQKVSHQLTKNKNAIRKTFKLAKYIFVILVINSLEDDIKTIFLKHLSNLNTWLIFIWLILTSLFFYFFFYIFQI